MGNSDAHVALTINTRENLLGCEIYINRNKELFNFLQEHKQEIEKEIGAKLEWIDASVASRVVLKREVAGVFNLQNEKEYFNWMYKKVVKFQGVFGKYIKEFKK